MRDAMSQRQALGASFTITPAFRVALSEAEALATQSESEVDDRAFANLTDSQKATLRVALLAAMSEIASNVAFFVGSHRLDAAAHLLAVLVVLVTLYRQLALSE
jgi:hypothetical protein